MFVAATPNRDPQRPYPLSVAGSGSQILRDAAGDIDDHVHCVFEYAIQGYVDDKEIPPKARKKIALQFDLIIGNEFDGYGETVLGRQGSLVLENEQKAMLFHTSDVDKILRIVEKKDAGKDAKGVPAIEVPKDGKADEESQALGRLALQGADAGFATELEHWAFCCKPPAEGKASLAKPRCDAEAGLYATVLTVAAAKAVKLETRVDFKNEWFDVKSDETPDTKILFRRSSHVSVASGSFCQHRRRSGRASRRGPRVGRAHDPASCPARRRAARPQRAREFLARVTDLGMKITVVFGGFEGESYADIPTVKRTVGLVPPETRAARLQEMKEIADFARLLGVDAVGLHLGFVPHDAADPVYGQVMAVARDLCGHCRAQGQRVHLETGQESADTLLKFLADAGCDNLFVNFDPANMILYGSRRSDRGLAEGRPLRAERTLQGRQVGRPSRRGVGRRGALGPRRRGHGAVPPHAQGDRLRRSADDRARDPAGPRAAEAGDRRRHAAAGRVEGEDPVGCVGQAFQPDLSVRLESLTYSKRRPTIILLLRCRCLTPDRAHRPRLFQQLEAGPPMPERARLVAEQKRAGQLGVSTLKQGMDCRVEQCHPHAPPSMERAHKGPRQVRPACRVPAVSPHGRAIGIAPISVSSDARADAPCNPETLANVGNVSDATAKAKFPDWKDTIKASDGYLFTAPRVPSGPMPSGCTTCREMRDGQTRLRPQPALCGIYRDIARKPL